MPIASLIALFAVCFASAGYGIVHVIADPEFPATGGHFLAPRERDRQVQQAWDVLFSPRHKVHLVMFAGGFSVAFCAGLFAPLIVR